MDEISLALAVLAKNTKIVMANYIGLMAGTSLDGVDGVVVNDDCSQIIASTYLPYTNELKQRLYSLNNTTISLKKLTKLDTDIACIFAKTVQQLLQSPNVLINDIKAIGSHGQTIYHHGGKYSMQIGHGAIIAEHSCITTVSDFRMADVAAGGQGAPLTPIFHQHLLNGSDGVVINLGGIANISIVKNNTLRAFDTGPANTLLDNWIKNCQQLDYDKDGLWASIGNVDERLLTALLADEYFQQAAPKSTGVEYFNLNWLADFLTGSERETDVQRTLVELTALSISQHIPQHSAVYLCGGGVYNLLLFERLRCLNPHSKINTTHDLGMHPDFVEASAFGFFAKRTLKGLPSNIPSITGANGKRVLGAIYHAKRQ